LNGVFITLEGGEGVGKSTQAVRLAAAIRDAGRTVIVTREPGGTAGAEAIRDLLMSGSEDRWNARAEALLFAAARADHVARVIAPALARGDVVVCDRFVDSSRAYQGEAGGVSDADIVELHRIGASGLMPDRTLVIALAEGSGRVRSAMRDGPDADRMGSRGSAYYASVDLAFLRMAASDPVRFRIVSGDGDAAAVTQRLFAAIEDLL